MADRIVDNLYVRLEFDCSAAQETINAVIDSAPPVVFEALAQEIAKHVKVQAASKPAKPYCCNPNCSQDAAFVLTDTRPETPYNVAETHACGDCARLLGADEAHVHVARMFKEY